MFHAMGHATGVNLEMRLACARSLPGIVGYEVPGHVATAGRIQDLHWEPGWPPEVRARALGQA